MAQHTGPIKVKMTAQYVIEQYLPGLGEIASSPYPGKLAFVVYKNLRLARKVEKRFDKARMEILDRFAERDEKGNAVVQVDENGKLTSRISVLPEQENAFSEAVTAEFYKVYEVEVYPIDESSIVDMVSVRPAALEAISPMLITTETDEQPTEAAEEVSENQPELQS